MLARRYRNSDLLRDFWGFDKPTDCLYKMDKWIESNFHTNDFNTNDWFSRPTLKDGILSHSIEVPGLSESDLKIEWKDDMLKVEGKSEKYSKTVSYTVSMPGIDPGTLEASCENGMLTVSAKVLGEDPTRSKGVQVQINNKK